MRIFLSVVFLLAILSPLQAATSDPGRCMAYYGAAADAQSYDKEASFGKLHLERLSGNFNDIDFAGRLAALQQRYADAAAQGTASGGRSIPVLRKSYFDILSGVGRMSQGGIVMRFINSCDTDEGFAPALKIAP